MNISKAIILFSLLNIASGCSYQSYDEENPSEYENYWGDKRNLENSLPHKVGADIVEEENKNEVEDYWRHNR